MTTIKSLFKRHAVLIYFVLTFVLTWGGMAQAAYPGGFPISEEQMEASGALVYVAMLVGPTGAGLLMTILTDGRTGLRELWSRLIRWRVGVRWYAVALLTAPLLMITILTLLSLLNPEFSPAIFTVEDKTSALLAAIAAGLAVGLFEELGWTGFAIPRLRQRYSILATGLIVGIVWGLWHFPPFWASDTFSGVFPLVLLLGQLFSWLPPYRMLMVRVYDHTESLLVSVLMHASLMASLTVFVPAELTGASLLTWILTWAAVLWLVVLVAVLVNKKRISRQITHKYVA